MSSNNGTAPPTSGPASSSNPPPNSPSAAPSSSPPPSPTPTPEPTPTPTPSPSPQPQPSSSRRNDDDTTSTVTAPSQTPTTTEVETSVIVITPSASRDGETPTPIVITSVVTKTNGQPVSTGGSLTGSPSASSTGGTQFQEGQKESSNGLSTGGKTAIAVVVPVVVVALLVIGGILFWRKRKQRKDNEDERRKEVEEYGYNPNHDPTLPAVGGAVMAEDESGYRGWGNTTTSSNRKGSTTLGSGMAYSDSTSNPGGYASPNSPTNAYSDANSNDPLVNGRRETMDSDGIGALGAVGGAAPNSTQNASGVHRGPSNASSSYSAANRSDNSGDYPAIPMSNPQDYYNDHNGYYQQGPYGQAEPYAPQQQQQPIIRDVSARRNTRIENPSVFPQQGNSGIAQNF